MNISQNIHPLSSWENVNVSLSGYGEGSCVGLELQDISGDCLSLYLHYGGGKNANKFVVMLKEAISKLPVKCETCGHEITKGE